MGCVVPKSLIENALSDFSCGPAERIAPLVQNEADSEIASIASSLDVCIKVVGCGGAGSNTVNRCHSSGLRGVGLCAMNTDAKHILTVKADKKILLGRALTRGLGAGARPEIGERAALESQEEIAKYLSDAQIVFVTAGMGGGTGTSSSSVVSRLAKARGALTVGVVTLPFRSEGELRMRNAMAGLTNLARVCDTTIVVPNDTLLELVPRLPVEAAFKVADELLVQTISGLAEMLTSAGLVNVDFADLRTILNEGGVSLIGVGESCSPSGGGSERLEEAMEDALNSPLLGKMDLKGAKGALVRIVGGPDMTIEEAASAAKMVSDSIRHDGRVIWGCSIEPAMEGRVRVLLIITGAQSKYVLVRRGEDTTMMPTCSDYRGVINVPSAVAEDEDTSMFVR
jgi:cell division protein FtsZ